MKTKKNSLDANVRRLSDQGFLQRTVRDVKLAFWLIRQRDVPILIKVVPVLALIYVISPIDLIPGFIPILGQADDVVILMLGIRFFLHLAPPSVVGRYEASQMGLKVIEYEE
jgi:uncharacterized membrane protein YkvA (DUF1232 family)